MVKSIIKKYTETGKVENQYRGGRKNIMSSRDRNTLVRIVKDQPTYVSEDSKGLANIR